MAAFDINVRSTGLTDMSGRFGQFQSQLPGVVESVSYAAAKMTVDRARPEVPRVSSRAANSLQVYLNGGRHIAQGGEGLDYYAWLEYGGRSGRGGSNYRREVPDGRYIHPAYERVRADIQRLMVTELADLTSVIFRG